MTRQFAEKAFARSVVRLQPSNAFSSRGRKLLYFSLLSFLFEYIFRAPEGKSDIRDIDVTVSPSKTASQLIQSPTQVIDDIADDWFEHGVKLGVENDLVNSICLVFR